MVFFGATAAGLFWTVNVRAEVVSCIGQGQRSSEQHFFKGVLMSHVLKL